MMPDQQTINAVIAKIEIGSIRTTSGSFQTTIADATALEGRPILGLTYEACPSSRTSSGSFGVTARFAATIRGESDPADQPAVSIAAVFEVEYRLPSEVDAPPDLLTYFAERNGIFNTWPYWREFFQSSLLRAGLPPVQLPVLRGVPVVALEQQSSGNPANEFEPHLPSSS